jgi:hypothetical protein
VYSDLVYTADEKYKYTKCNSNMTSFKRFESKPVVRIILIYDQELLNLTEHLSSPPGFTGVRVTRSLVFMSNVL